MTPRAERLAAEHELPRSEFATHRVPTSYDLLCFIEEHYSKNILEKIAEDPDRWIEELNTLQQMLTGRPLAHLTGINQPPLGDPEFQQLGPSLYLYRGENARQHGLWVSKQTDFNRRTLKKEPYTEWSQIRIGSTATVSINQEFIGVKPEDLLPENIANKSKNIGDKRPIYKIVLENGGNPVSVYVKGADTSVSYLTSRPSYRLTSIAGIERTTSRDEMRRLVELSELGIAVPRVIGYYESPTREFLFVEEVEGTRPDYEVQLRPENKPVIIQEDARMLAALCLAGYRKIGFTDFDDKVYQDGRVYLIDTDELRDLYWPTKPEEYRKMVLNPGDVSQLVSFRMFQKQSFEQALKDALFRYRDSLLRSPEDQALYVKSFFKAVNWPVPLIKQVKALCEFGENYQTLDSYMALMSDSS